MGDAEGYLIRFQDGPCESRKDLIVPTDLFGWPLPDRLRVLLSAAADAIALWDAAKTPPEVLPATIAESPNLVFYEKINESQLPQSAEAYHVLRGALYRLETTLSPV